MAALVAAVAGHAASAHGTARQPREDGGVGAVVAAHVARALALLAVPPLLAGAVLAALVLARRCRSEGAVRGRWCMPGCREQLSE